MISRHNQLILSCGLGVRSAELAAPAVIRFVRTCCHPVCPHLLSSGFSAPAVSRAVRTCCDPGCPHLLRSGLSAPVLSSGLSSPAVIRFVLTCCHPVSPHLLSSGFSAPAVIRFLRTCCHPVSPHLLSSGLSVPAVIRFAQIGRTGFTARQASVYSKLLGTLLALGWVTHFTIEGWDVDAVATYTVKSIICLWEKNNVLAI